MGFAYVEMSSESEAIKAVEQLNGEELNGRRIHVRRTIDLPMSRAASQGFPVWTGKVCGDIFGCGGGRSYHVSLLVRPTRRPS
jgi:RNA recognition motif-containing protein